MNIGLKEICTIVGILVLGFLFVKGFMIEPHKENKDGDKKSGSNSNGSTSSNSSDGKL